MQASPVLLRAPETGVPSLFLRGTYDHMFLVERNGTPVSGALSSTGLAYAVRLPLQDWRLHQHDPFGRSKPDGRHAGTRLAVRKKGVICAAERQCRTLLSQYRAQQIPRAWRVQHNGAREITALRSPFALKPAISRTYYGHLRPGGPWSGTPMSTPAAGNHLQNHIMRSIGGNGSVIRWPSRMK